jgi:hypothetical protein
VSFAFSAYLALFLSPVLVWIYSKLWDNFTGRQKSIKALLVIPAVAAITYALWKADRPFPYLINYIHDSGLGPMLIETGDASATQAASFVFILLTGISLLGLYWIVEIIKSRNIWLPAPRKPFLIAFCLLFLAAYFLLNSFIYPFDRYCLPAFPFFCLLISPGESSLKKAPKIAGIPLIVMLFYSIAGSRDYFACNRIRWEIARNLLDKNVAPSQIDGGLEFNGWYLYDPDYEAKPGKNSWWVKDDLYKISTCVPKNRNLIETREYFSWLHFSWEKIYLTKRERP